MPFGMNANNNNTQNQGGASSAGWGGGWGKGLSGWGKNNSVAQEPIPSQTEKSQQQQQTENDNQGSTAIKTPILGSIFSSSRSQSPPKSNAEDDDAENDTKDNVAIEQQRQLEHRRQQKQKRNDSSTGVVSESSQSKSLNREDSFEQKMKEKIKSSNNEDGLLIWLEEDLRQRITEEGPLNDDEEYALGLFDDSLSLTQSQTDELVQIAMIREKEILEEEELADLIQKQENGTTTDDDEDRIYHLDLLIRNRRGETLTSEEEEDLELLEEQTAILKNDDDNDDDEADEADTIIGEFNELLDRKEDGEVIDEDRLLELELSVRERQGEELTPDEQRELNFFERKRRAINLDMEEFEQLVAAKESGEVDDVDDVDEDRLFILELVMMDQNNEQLTEEELELLEDYVSQRDNDILDSIDMDELEDLLERKNRGEDVDEDRINKLQRLDEEEDDDDEGRDKVTTSEKQQSSSNEEQDDVPTEEKSFTNDDSPKNSNSNDVKSDTGNLTEEEMDDDFDTESENSILRRELEKHGLPMLIKFGGDNKDDFHNSRLSFRSTSDDSYVHDLLSQRDRREQERREEILEDALELYQIALQEKNLPESEQLFLGIYEQLLKENTEKFKEQDRIQDERIETELKLQTIRKQEREKEKQQEARRRAEEEARRKREISAASKNDTISGWGIRLFGRKNSAAAEEAKKKAEIEAAERAAKEAMRLMSSSNEGAQSEAPETQQESKISTGSDDMPQQSEMSTDRGVVDEPMDEPVIPLPSVSISAMDSFDDLPDRWKSPEGKSKRNVNNIVPSDELPVMKAEQIFENDEASKVPQSPGNTDRLLVHSDRSSSPIRSDNNKTNTMEPNSVHSSSTDSAVLSLVDKSPENETPQYTEGESSLKADTSQEDNRNPSDDDVTSKLQSDRIDSVGGEESSVIGNENKPRNEGVPNHVLEADDGDNGSELGICADPQLTDLEVPASVADDSNGSLESASSQSVASSSPKGDANGSSGGSIGDELASLMELKTQGIGLSESQEDLFYELDVLTRMKKGEELSPSEREDAKVYTTRRANLARWQQEYEEMLDIQDAGGEVDPDRFYFLELVDKRRMNESLTESELDDLEVFEEEEATAWARNEEENAEMESVGSEERSCPKNAVSTTNVEAVDDVEPAGDMNEASQPEIPDSTAVTGESSCNVHGDADSNSDIERNESGNKTEKVGSHSFSIDTEPANTGLGSTGVALVPPSGADDSKDVSEFVPTGGPKDNDGSSCGSISAELAPLIELKSQGVDMSESQEDLFYELDILSRMKRGEGLSPSELQDAHIFKQQRSWQREYEHMLGIQDAGGEVDQDRFYFLELVDKRRLNESLTESELDDLEMFEEAELSDVVHADKKGGKKLAADLPDDFDEVKRPQDIVDEEIAQADQTPIKDDLTVKFVSVVSGQDTDRSDPVDITNGCLDHEGVASTEPPDVKRFEGEDAMAAKETLSKEEDKVDESTDAVDDTRKEISLRSVGDELEKLGIGDIRTEVHQERPVSDAAMTMEANMDLDDDGIGGDTQDNLNSSDESAEPGLPPSLDDLEVASDGANIDSVASGAPDDVHDTSTGSVEEELAVLLELKVQGVELSESQEDLFYELDVLSRRKRGEDLSALEHQDAEVFERRRSNISKWKREYEDMLDIQESGGEVDPDRFYFLELVDKRRLNESLTGSELDDLEMFEGDEEAAAASSEGGKKDSIEQARDPYDSNEGFIGADCDGEESNHSSDAASEVRPDNILGAGVLTLKDGIGIESGEDKDNRSLGGDRTHDLSSDPIPFEKPESEAPTDTLKEEDSEAVAEPDGASECNGSEEDEDPSAHDTHVKPELLGAEAPKLEDDGDVDGGGTGLDRESNLSSHDNKAEPAIAAQELTDSGVVPASGGVPKGGDGSASEQSDTSGGSYHEDGSSSGSIKEQLASLLELKSQGDGLSESQEDLLYELDVLSRMKQGGVLSPSEMQDAKIFELRRKNQSKWKQEYEEFLDIQDAGGKVDPDRFYFLELADKRRLNESLTESELDDLEMFEEEEIVLAANGDMDDVEEAMNSAVFDNESRSGSDISPTADLSGEKRNEVGNVVEEEIQPLPEETIITVAVNEKQQDCAGIALDSHGDEGSEDSGIRNFGVGQTDEGTEPANDMETFEEERDEPGIGMQGTGTDNDSSSGTEEKGTSSISEDSDVDIETSIDVVEEQTLPVDMFDADTSEGSHWSAIKNPSAPVHVGEELELSGYDASSIRDNPAVNIGFASNDGERSEFGESTKAAHSVDGRELIREASSPPSSIGSDDGKDASRPNDDDNVSSIGSIEEELASLLELKSQGVALSDSQEDLLYELDVISRKKHGKDLTPSELKDAKVFELQHANRSKWQQEYEDMLDIQEAGGEVDQDRFYLLELVDKRRLNESLTESELDDLELFEEDEEAVTVAEIEKTDEHVKDSYELDNERRSSEGISPSTDVHSSTDVSEETKSTDLPGTGDFAIEDEAAFILVEEKDGEFGNIADTRDISPARKIESTLESSAEESMASVSDDISLQPAASPRCDTETSHEQTPHDSGDSDNRNESVPDHSVFSVEKWMDRDTNIPEDLDAACRLMIPRVYKDHEVDIDRMLQRTPALELYKYLSQQLEYEDLHENEAQGIVIGDPGHSFQTENFGSVVVGQDPWVEDTAALGSGEQNDADMIEPDKDDAVASKELDPKGGGSDTSNGSIHPKMSPLLTSDPVEASGSASEKVSPSAGSGIDVDGLSCGSSSEKFFDSSVRSQNDSISLDGSIAKELASLEELKSQGIDLSFAQEDLYYELSLLSREERGEELSPEELEDVRCFKMRRARLSKWQQEFEEMLDIQVAGGEVDPDRFYFLELVDRRRLDESLTESELCDLETFEEEEEDETGADEKETLSAGTGDVASAKAMDVIVDSVDGVSMGSVDTGTVSLPAASKNDIVLLHDDDDDDDDFVDTASETKNSLNASVSDPPSSPEHRVEKWVDRDKNIPEDLEGACRLMIPRIYKDHTVDIDSMLQRTPALELYKYLLQQLEYEDLHADDEVHDGKIGDPGHSMQTENFSLGDVVMQSSLPEEAKASSVGENGTKLDEDIIIDNSQASASNTRENEIELDLEESTLDASKASTLSVQANETKSDAVIVPEPLHVCDDQKNDDCHNTMNTDGLQEDFGLKAKDSSPIDSSAVADDPEDVLSEDMSIDLPRGVDSVKAGGNNPTPGSAVEESKEGTHSKVLLSSDEKANEEHVSIASTNLSEKDGDHSSSGASVEEELASLLDLKSKGISLSESQEDIFYELDVLSRMKHGKELSPSEVKDAEFYKKRRSNLLKWQKEYEKMLDIQDAGGEVDPDRFYFLELVDKRCLNEPLTESELDDLDMFEEEELGVASTEDDMAGVDDDSSSGQSGEEDEAGCDRDPGSDMVVVEEEVCREGSRPDEIPTLSDGTPIANVLSIETDNNPTVNRGEDTDEKYRNDDSCSEQDLIRNDKVGDVGDVGTTEPAEAALETIEVAVGPSLGGDLEGASPSGDMESFASIESNHADHDNDEDDNSHSADIQNEILTATSHADATTVERHSCADGDLGSDNEGHSVKEESFSHSDSIGTETPNAEQKSFVMTSVPPAATEVANLVSADADGPNDDEGSSGASIAEEYTSLLELKMQGVSFSESQEDLFYELDVQLRMKKGEELSPSEMQDAQFFKKRRDKLLKWQTEYEEMLDIQDAGGKVDPDRFYFLELADKRRLDESMTESELDDLEMFEEKELAISPTLASAVEDDKDRAAANDANENEDVIDSAGFDEDSSFAGREISPTSDGAGEESDHSGDVFEKEIRPDNTLVAENSMKDLTTLGGGDGIESAVNENMGSDMKQDSVSNRSCVVADPACTPCLDLFSSVFEDAIECESKESISSSRSLPGSSKEISLTTDPAVVGVSTSRDAATKKIESESFDATTRMLEDNSVGDGSMGDSSEDGNSKQNPGCDIAGAVEEDASETRQPSVASGGSKEDMSSFGSIEEELESLLELKTEGVTLSESQEDLYYELDVQLRMKKGEELSKQELEDAKFYSKKRINLSKWKQEYDDMLNIQDAGGEVDPDRFYFLELVDKRRMNESLTESELDDLDMFEEEGAAPDDDNTDAAKEVMDSAGTNNDSCSMKESSTSTDRVEEMVQPPEDVVEAGKRLENTQGAEVELEDDLVEDGGMGSESDEGDDTDRNSELFDDAKGFAPFALENDMDDDGQPVLYPTDTQDDSVSEKEMHNVKSDSENTGPSKHINEKVPVQLDQKHGAAELAGDHFAVDGNMDLYDVDSNEDDSKEFGETADVSCAESGKKDYDSGGARQELADPCVATTTGTHSDDGLESLGKHSIASSGSREEDVSSTGSIEEQLSSLLELKSQGVGLSEPQEDLFYELDVVSRMKRGEELSSSELKDAKYFKRRRANLSKWQREYEEMLDLQDAGGDVDQDRFYFLELIDRRQLNESLTESELDDLQMFEEDEIEDYETKNSRKVGEQPVGLHENHCSNPDGEEVEVTNEEEPADFCGDSGSDLGVEDEEACGSEIPTDGKPFADDISEQLPGLEDRSLVPDGEEKEVTLLEEPSFETFSELDETPSSESLTMENDVAMGSNVDSHDPDRNEGSSSKQDLGSENVDVETEPANVVQDSKKDDLVEHILDSNDAMEFGGSSVANVEAPSASAIESQAEDTKNLEDINKEIKPTDEIPRDDATKAAKDHSARDSQQVSETNDGGNGSQSVGESQELTDVEVPLFGVNMDYALEGARSVESGGSKDVSSGGSIAEELASLLELKSQGISLSESQEDLYYELDVLSRMKKGEELSTEELEDARFFEKRRSNLSNWQQEYEEMLDIQDAGGEVDQNRFYFLKLVDKRRLNESLTESELGDLEMFEEEEDAADAADTNEDEDAVVTKGQTMDSAGPKHEKEILEGSDSVGVLEAPSENVETESATTAKNNETTDSAGSDHDQKVSEASDSVGVMEASSDNIESQGATTEKNDETADSAGSEHDQKISEASDPVELKVSAENFETDVQPDEPVTGSSPLGFADGDGGSVNAEKGRNDKSHLGLDRSEPLTAIPSSSARSSTLPFGSEHDPVTYARSHALSLLSLDDTFEASGRDVSFHTPDEVDGHASSSFRTDENTLNLGEGDERKSPIEDFDDVNSEQQELEELNLLLGMAENGEDFDEERLYELELRTRNRNGEELSPQETTDLEFFVVQRERDRRYEDELLDLLSKQEEGIEIDEERLYFLELLDRQRNGEPLDEEELEDLELLLAEEGAKTNVDDSAIAEDEHTRDEAAECKDEEGEVGMENQDQGELKTGLDESVSVSGSGKQQECTTDDVANTKDSDNVEVAREEASKAELAKIKASEVEISRQAAVEEAKKTLAEAKAALEEAGAAAKRAAIEEEETLTKTETATVEAEIKLKIAEEDAKQRKPGVGWGRLFGGRDAEEEKHKEEALEEARKAIDESKRLMADARAAREEADDVVENKEAMLLKAKADLVEAETQLQVARETAIRTRDAAIAANQALKDAQLVSTKDEEEEEEEKQKLIEAKVVEAETMSASAVVDEENTTDEPCQTGEENDRIIIDTEDADKGTNNTAESVETVEEDANDDSLIETEAQLHIAIRDVKDQHTRGGRRAVGRRARLRERRGDAEDEAVVNTETEDENVQRTPEKSEVPEADSFQEDTLLDGVDVVEGSEAQKSIDADPGEASAGEALKTTAIEDATEKNVEVGANKELIHFDDEKISPVENEEITVGEEFSDLDHHDGGMDKEPESIEMAAKDNEKHNERQDSMEDELSTNDEVDAKQTEILEAYRLEYEELLEIKDSGGTVDEDRMYFLELVDRRREGEFLTEEELFDLEDFEAEEMAAVEEKTISTVSSQVQDQELTTEEDLSDIGGEGPDASVALTPEKQPKVIDDDEGEGEEQQQGEGELSLDVNEEEVLDGTNNVVSLQNDDSSEKDFDGMSESVDNAVSLSTNQDSDLPNKLGGRDSDAQNIGNDIGHLVCDEDQEYFTDLEKKQEGGSAMDNDEKAEFEFIRRLLDGDQLEEDEVQELDLLRMTRKERQADKNELNALRHRRDRGEDYDEEILYELELFEKDRHGENLDDDQIYELELFERRRNGDALSEVEEEDLLLLRRQREEQRLDEEDLRDLRERKKNGEEVDEELLYELELFQKKRSGETLNDDEVFEFDMFERRRLGETLHEDELAELEHLARLRQESMLDEAELDDLRRRKKEGELVDEDWLYELELYHKKRRGIDLNENEKFEISLFGRRRDGIELNEDELDELDMLKKQRLEKAGLIISTGVDTQADDSKYLRELLAKSGRGEDLTNDEITEFQLLDRKLHGEELQEDELDELEILKHRRLERAAEAKKSQSRMDAKQKQEESKKPKKEKKLKKPKKEKKPKEKKMRRKRRRVKVKKYIETSDEDVNQGKQEVVTSEGKETKTPTPTPLIAAPSPKPAPPIGNDRRTTVFGSLFGGRQNNKKQQELEEQRRRQEELIKEQLRALDLETELKELEKEKETQEKLVQESMEQKFEYVSESESYSSLETDPEWVGEDSESEESEESEDSNESEGSGDETLNASIGGGDITIRDSPEPMDNDDSGAIVAVSISPPQLRSQGRRPRRPRPPGLTRRIEEPQPKSPMDAEKTPSPDVDDASDASSEASEPTVVSTDAPKSPEKVPNLARITARARARSKGSRPRRSKSVLLEEHLEKQKKQSSSVKTNKHGDEISLGTLNMKKRRGKKRPDVVDDFVQNTRGGSKHERPWKNEMAPVRPEPKLGAISESAAAISHGKAGERFSDFDKEVFERSVFNRSVFNLHESFKSAPDLEVDDSDEDNETVTDTVVSAVVQKEEEIAAQAEAEEEEANREEEEALGDTYSTLHFNEPGFGLGLLDYEQIESKLAERLKNKDAEFDEKWEEIEADKAVAAQMSRRRQDRQRKQTNGKKEKEEADIDDIPRLFLFEGEKLDSTKKKKRRKKKSKKLRKLDHKLSKEFRKAMKEIFESDSEESYDKTFGEGGDSQNGNRSRRFSMADSSDSNSILSASSRVSDAISEGFEDEYLKRLRLKSMQRDVKEMLHESQSSALSKKSEHSDDRSAVSKSSEVSRQQSRNNLRPGSQSSMSQTRRKRRKRRIRRNRSGEVVGPDIDPADVYAKEIEKTKARTTFSIAELRKEMEEMKNTSFGGFDPAPATKPMSFLNNPGVTRTPPQPKQKKGFLQRLTKTPSRSPGPETLAAMNPQAARPALGNRQISFGQGLLNANRTGFDIGGTLAAPPVIDEGDEEALFGNNNDSPGAGYDNSVRNRTVRPTLTTAASALFKGGGTFASPRKATTKGVMTPTGQKRAGLSRGPLPGGSLPTGPLPSGPLAAGGLGGTGFQEPLPLPEMQDDDTQRKRGFGLGKFAGKMKRMAPKMNFGRKNPGQEFGGALVDEDSDDGGMGLLG